MKIISILPHLPQEIIHEYKSGQEYLERFPESEIIEIEKPPYWIGFFKLDWHHKFSRYVKKIDDSIDIECWRPYGDNIDEVYEKNVEGIKHKVFPVKKIRIPKFGYIEISQPIVDALKQEINTNQIIIHFYGAHFYLQNWILNKLKPINTPVIVQQLGGAFGIFDFKVTFNPLKLIYHLYEKSSLKYVDIWLTGSKVEYNYLRKLLSPDKVKYFYNGIDISNYPIISKEEARNKIGINQDKKVILYVGRLYKTKDADFIIMLYNSLKEKDKDILLLIVGCYENDEFFELAKNSGAKIFLRSDNPINIFFAASDLYLVPVKNKIVQNFGGTGIAPLEALIYNVPVISKNLIHFPAENHIIQELGVFVYDDKNLKEIIINTLNSNRRQYQKSRDIVIEYLDINKNTKKLIEIYSNLYKEHYE